MYDPEKIRILKENGWQTLWHPDNWIKYEWLIKYTNIDHAGIRLEEAYKQCLADIKYKEEYAIWREVWDK